MLTLFSTYRSSAAYRVRLALTRHLPIFAWFRNFLLRAAFRLILVVFRNCSQLKAQ